jgi:hypothetical protein
MSGLTGGITGLAGMGIDAIGSAKWNKLANG